MFLNKDMLFIIDKLSLKSLGERYYGPVMELFATPKRVSVQRRTHRFVDQASAGPGLDRPTKRSQTSS